MRAPVAALFARRPDDEGAGRGSTINATTAAAGPAAR